MADINVDVNLPSTISVDVTSPTQALATNISIPGPQGPRGEKGNPTTINNLSAENIIITGTDGNIIYTTGLNTIFVSGNSGYFQSAVNTLTTNLNSTGSSLSNSINNLSGLFTGYTGNLDNTYATDAQLNSTGSNLNNKITLLSGTLTSTYATISNLAATGSTLTSNINSLNSTFTGFTGNLDATYATDTQLANTGSTLNTKIDNLSGYVNAQDLSISNNLASTGSTLQSNINTVSSNLNLTGVNLENKITLLSGTLTGNYLTINSAVNTYATINNLASTGNTLINNINSLSGTLTGNYLTSSSVSNIYATINNLNSTGSNLNDKINSLSGALNSSGTNLNNSIIFLSGLFTGFTGNLDASYATDIQLQNTGSTLNENINNLSGTLTNNYYLKSNPSGFITGVDLSSYITSSTASLTYATISNLALTGSTLNFEINSLSGTLTSTYATISNLATTGSTLINNINSLSGTLTGDYVTKSNGQFNNRPTVNGTGVLLSGEVAALPATIVYTTGNQTISGDKNFVENIIIGDATQENLFVISGNEISFGVIPTVSGNPLLTGINLTAYITTGQTGSFYPNSNPSGFITGIDLSNYATINNLELTGSTLNYNINSLSGSAVLLYGDQSVGGIKTFRDKVYINNLYVTGTETILNTTNNNIASPYLLLNLTGGLTDGGIFFVTGIGLTGTNDSGVIFGFDNITKSWHFGQGTRLTDISTLDEVMGYHDLSGYSGYVNNTFSTITNLASTGSTLQTNINTVSSNLANTGSTLDSKIGSLSGTLTSNYATISNLASTGSTLNSNIDSLSGTLTSNYATITNLASTGSTLQTNINNLSGYINSSNSNIVFTTGNQTINGLKTFNSGVVINVQPTGTNPALYITGTWNDANIPYSGLVIDITDTNSKVTNTVGDTSYLLELKKNNTSQIALTHKTNYSTSIPSIHNTASSLNIGRTNSTLYFGATQGGNAHAILSNNAFTVRNATAIGWSAASAGSDIGSQDLILAKDLSGILALRNGTNPQQFRVYNITGTNTGEFGLFGWDAGNNLIIGPQATQSGTLRNVTITGSNINITTTGEVYIGDGALRVGKNAAGGTNIIAAGTNVLSLQGNATNGGYGNVAIGPNGAAQFFVPLYGYPQVRADGYYAWSNNVGNAASTPDLYLYRDSAGILAQRNGTNAQQFRVYNSTGTNSGEFGLLGWQNNQLILASQKTNSGILRDVVISGANINLYSMGDGTVQGGQLQIPYNTDYNSLTFRNAQSNVNYLQLKRYLGSTSGPLFTTIGFTSSISTNSASTADIFIERDGAGILSQRNGTNAQQFRVFNSTGTNSGEFGLLGWINSGLVIGPQQTNSGILRDLTLTGANININASGILNVFDNTNIVGNLTVSGNTTITGHLSAASKSFLIDHPTIIGKKLQYGSLESPYHGIRLTDKNKISADSVKVNLPDYISALVNEDKVNVQLTNINHDKVLFVKEVNVNQNNFVVGINRGWFDKNEYEFYWSFTAERKDIPKLTVEF